MPEMISTVHGSRVLIYPSDGEVIANESSALEILGEAFGHNAEVVVIPADRLGDDFFRLSTRVAGEIMQKFATYRRLLVIVGDISAYVAASSALRDLVAESNRGDHVWFLPGMADLDERLAAREGV